jgi:hypothetical protein
MTVDATSLLLYSIQYKSIIKITYKNNKELSNFNNIYIFFRSFFNVFKVINFRALVITIVINLFKMSYFELIKVK